MAQSSKQQHQVEVFLGGSCNPTTWRHEHAIPYYQSRSVSYYNPQVEIWTPDLVEVEHYAKESASLLFFVIDHDTRSLAAITEVCYSAAERKNIIVVINPMPRDKNQIKFIQQKNSFDENDNQQDYENTCQARKILRILLQYINVPVFDNVKLALEYSTFILENSKQNIINTITFDNNETYAHSILNKKQLQSSDDISHLIDHQSHIISSSPIDLTQSHWETSTIFRARSPILLSPSPNSKLEFPNRQISNIIKREKSCSINENDDDGYGSLILSDQTISRSSSTISADYGEYLFEQNNEIKFSNLSILNKLLLIFSSYLSLTSLETTIYSSTIQSLSTLSTMIFHLIKHKFHYFISKSLSIKSNFDLNSSSKIKYDIYIASGSNDNDWLNTIVYPSFEKFNINYVKRNVYHRNQQFSIIENICKCNQSRLLYYIINNNERLSDLITELAFIIGEHKHHVIVCLKPKINENSENILTINERKDLERSRKYLEDFAKKENIYLYQSRKQSWQQVLAFLL